MAGAVIEVKYFNTFLLKKTSKAEEPIWNGSYGIPSDIGGYPVVSNINETSNWAIEESRIRGGYNNTTVDFGVKAYIVEDEPNQAIKASGLIYSGIFNSRTGINRTNVFSVAEEITGARMLGARVVVVRAVARRRASRDARRYHNFSVGETTKSRPARVTETDRRRPPCLWYMGTRTVLI